MGFEAIVFYQGSKRFSNNPTKGIDFKEIFKQMIQNIIPENRIDMHSLWILSERLVEPWDYGNMLEIYPAVAFIANISEMID